MRKIYSTFQSALQDRGLTDVMHLGGLQKRLPMNSKAFAEALTAAVKRGDKIRIDGDCDADGFLSALSMKTAFDKIGYTNYTVTKHITKRHSLSMAFLSTLVEEGYKTVIILDSSSNSMEGIEFLCNHGVNVLIADHHKTNYVFKDFPEGCIIVNPKIDARFKPTPYSQICAGALTALLCDFWLSSTFGMKDNRELYVYGAISLYADSCDMGNAFNRSFVNEFRDTVFLPPLIEMFLNEWSSFNRSFISFYLIPRINALIRSERFDFIHQLFFGGSVERGGSPGSDFMPRESQLAFIEECYLNNKALVEAAPTMGKIIEKDAIVSMLIPYTLQKTYRNFTGLVASQLATKYDKAAMCVVQVSENSFEGSGRDCRNRDILSIFQSVCFAEGHDPAFGVEMPTGQLDTNLDYINEQLKLLPPTDNVIVVDWTAEERSIAEVQSELVSMATYNEFSGGSLPLVYCRFVVPKSAKITQTKRSSQATIYGMPMVSFNRVIEPGLVVLCKANYNGTKAQLLLEAVLGVDETQYGN